MMLSSPGALGTAQQQPQPGEPLMFQVSKGNSSLLCSSASRRALEMETQRQQRFPSCLGGRFGFVLPLLLTTSDGADFPGSG